MISFIFLDNWVLSDYTKQGKFHLLSNFIRRNNYTVLINRTAIAELYNSGWQNAKGDDRVARAATFLGEHSCAIIDPAMVFRSEIEKYPNRLEQLPVQLSLNELPGEHRTPALLSILRREGFLLEHGVDIKKWVAEYDVAKTDWLESASRIIEDACNTGALMRDKDGRFANLQENKEEFLITLDRRHFSHFSSEERAALGTKIVELFMSATKVLPAVRFSSLCFWYAYIEQDKSYPMRRSGSDIGDFYQMSLIPYCSAFTLDITMYRLARRVMADASYNCKLLNREQLDTVLAGGRAQLG